MINKTDFKIMQNKFNAFDQERETMIKDSRDVIKQSKQIINSLHRNELDNATKLVDIMKKSLIGLNKLIKKTPKLYFQGTYKAAAMEYVEAMLYYGFVKDKKIYTRKFLNVSPDHYLLGIADLTGELTRRAILSAIKTNYKTVIAVRDIIEEIHYELSKFDFRENEMRRKYDSIKYDLKKIEDLILELTIKGKI